MPPDTPGLNEAVKRINAPPAVLAVIERPRQLLDQLGGDDIEDLYRTVEALPAKKRAALQLVLAAVAARATM